MQPQRPFVPHRTPNASRPPASNSEFQLSRPFVPGSPREEAEVAQADREQLPAIEAFLDNSPQRSESQFGGQSDEDSFGFAEEQEGIPPVEHFLDPLPPVVSFAPDTDGALIDEPGAAMDFNSPPPSVRAAGEAEWVEDDWQQFDWRAAAALGDGLDAEATNDWAETDWDMGPQAPRDAKPTAAQAIAKALDQIARKIRQGELTVPPADALTDPAGIAATLAALLGVRR